MTAIAIFFMFAALGLAAIVASFVATLVHEIGHAVPALLFKSSHVKILIGSYEPHPKSIKIPIGKVELLIHPNPVRWLGGACNIEGRVPGFYRQLVFIISGPLAECMLAVSAWIVLNRHEPDGLWFLFWGGLLIVCIVGVVVSMIPRKLGSYSLSGDPIYNDGFLIWHLLKHNWLPSDIQKSIDRFFDGDTDAAISEINTLIANGCRTQHVLHFAIYGNLHLKNYEKAWEINELMMKKYTPESTDYYNAAITQYGLKNIEAAIQLYEKALDKEPGNVHALNGLGYTFGKIGRLEEALPLLDRALAISPEFTDALNSRASLMIAMSKPEQALANLTRSLELDTTKADTHTTLGQYYLLIGDRAQALNHFEKAKDLGEDPATIDELLNPALPPANT